MQCARAGIDRHGIHPVVRPRPQRVERRIRRSGGGQAHDAIVGRGVERGEVAGHHHSAIGLQGDGLHRVVHHVTEVHPRTGIKGGVQRAVRVDPGHAVAAEAVVGAKTAAEENPPVGLKRNGVDVIVRARAGVERRVNLAVVEQPRDAVAGGGVHRREVACEDRALVRLDHQGKDHVVRTGRRVVRRTGEPVAVLVVRVVRRTRRLLAPVDVVGHNGHDGLEGAAQCVARRRACGEWVGGFLARGTYPQQSDEDVLIQFHLSVVKNRNAEACRTIASANGHLERLQIRREVGWTQKQCLPAGHGVVRPGREAKIVVIASGGGAHRGAAWQFGQSGTQAVFYGHGKGVVPAIPNDVDPSGSPLLRHPDQTARHGYDAIRITEECVVNVQNPNGLRRDGKSRLERGGLGNPVHRSGIGHDIGDEDGKERVVGV